MRGRTVAVAFGLVAISLLLLLPVASATTSDPAAVTFTSPNPQLRGDFGFSVAVSGTSVVVGASGETAGGLPMLATPIYTHHLLLAPL